MRVAVHGQYVTLAYRDTLTRTLCEGGSPRTVRVNSDIQGYSDKGVHTLCEVGSPRTVHGVSELL